MSIASSEEFYRPSAEIVANARIKDWEATARFAAEDLEGFWAKEATELEWFRQWDKVLDDSKKPFYQVVRGRQDQHRATTAWTATRRPGAATSWR